MFRISEKSRKGVPLLNQSIATVSQLLIDGHITADQLCRICLQRINAIQKLNAFVTLTEQMALQKSLHCQQRIISGNRLSLLDAIPIAFKDNFCTKDVRTSCASKMLVNYIPTYNATVVERLVDDCGAVMLGKTNLDEYAMGSGSVDSLFGPTVNPWKSGLPFKVKSGQSDELQAMSGIPENDWHVSGGSSGGSAVAVASGACFAAIASDTGGSTRNPAARVGIIGFKPTYGLVSRYGLIPLTHSMDVPGIMARYVDDVCLVLAAIAGHDTRDSTTVTNKIEHSLEDIDFENLRVGIPDEYECEDMSDDVIDTWRTFADMIANCGARVERVSLPHTKYSISCYSVLNCSEVASNFSCYDGIEFGHRAQSSDITVDEVYAKSRREGFNDIVRGRILAGNYFLLRENYEKYFNKAMKVRRLIANDFENVFNKQNIDFLLTPVTLTEAPLHSVWIQKDNRQHVSKEDYCTQPVNMAGLPAISIPIKLSNNGLPLSLQLIGKRFDDFFLLSVAKKLESILSFPVLVYDEN